MIYTIFTNDEILAKQQLNKILDKVNLKDDMMNQSSFDCANANIDEFLDYANTAPFFAKYKAAILKNPVFLTGEKTKANFEDFIEKFNNYLDDPVDTTIVIIMAIYPKLDDRKKIVKRIKNDFKFLSVEAPNVEELYVMLSKMASKRNCQITREATESLIQRVGSNLVDLVSEIEKLTLYKSDGVINVEDLEDFVEYSIESNIFELSNAILEHKTGYALELLDDMAKYGMEPIVLLSILANQLRIALLAREYRLVGMNQSSIAKKLKIHPYRVKLALELKFDDAKIKDLLSSLASLDYSIKTGKVNKHQGLRLLILKLK